MTELLTAQIFGLKHIQGLFYVLLIVVIGLVLFLKNAEKKQTLIIMTIFYILEVLKLGYLIIRDGSYPINHLPFHLCSMPLYIWPILYFSKPSSKLHKYAEATAFATILGGGIVALLYPETIIGNNDSWFPFTDNFLPFVSFTYHAMMIMSSLYLVLSKQYHPKYSDAFKAITLTLVFMIIAIIVNFSLDQDFMLLNRGNGSPFNTLIQEKGQMFYTFFMIGIGVLVIGFLSIIGTTFYYLINKAKKIIKRECDHE